MTAENFLSLLQEGRIWDAMTQVYTNIMGALFFAALFVLLPAAMVYIKTRSFVPATLILILGSAIFSVLLPTPMKFFFGVLSALGIAVILFRAFSKG